MSTNSIPIQGNLDLLLNQLLQAKLETLAADPTNSTARIYYNSTINKIKYFDNTTWRTVIDDATPHVLATNTGLGAMHTISGAAVGQVLRASGATSAMFAQLQHSDLGLAGTNTHAQIDTHIADATKHRVINDSGSSTTELFSASKILQLVSTMAAGALINKGGYDAATDTPHLDGTPFASPISNGFTYVVTVAGNFFTEAVEIGDMLIAKQDSPTLLTHWTLVNKNIPTILAATESVAGIIKIAPVISMVNGTTDDSTAVTPKKLIDYLAAGTADVTRKFVTALGTGAATTFVITHNLNSSRCIAMVSYTASPYNIVMVPYENTSANTTTLYFVTAPGINQFTVVIIG